VKSRYRSAGLQQIDVGAAVDERHDAARTHALGKQARHDVVFVVIGHRDERSMSETFSAARSSFVGDVPCSTSARSRRVESISQRLLSYSMILIA